MSDAAANHWQDSEVTLPIGGACLRLDGVTWAESSVSFFDI